MPTPVSTSRRMGCIQAGPLLIPATTNTTAVVMAVVTMSSERPIRPKMTVPIQITAAIPKTLNGKIRKYKKQSAKLRTVASVRDMAARSLWRVLYQNTKIVATTAHIPPSRSLSRDTEYSRARMLVMSQ